MDTDRLKELLQNYKQNAISEEELLKELRLVGDIITDSLRKQTPRALSEYLSAATKAKRLEANRRKTEAEAGRFHE